MPAAPTNTEVTVLMRDLRLRATWWRHMEVRVLARARGRIAAASLLSPASGRLHVATSGELGFVARHELEQHMKKVDSWS
jgi:hypothetical protein